MNGKVYHHAFRTEYPGITNVLVNDCQIALPSAVDPNRQKKFITFKAIWDTGATNTVITENVAKQVALNPTGMTETYGVHGKNIVHTYIIDILLPNNVCIPNIQVTEGILFSEVDILIGMDIIQLGDFNISNSSGKTTFSYCLPPHKNRVDLLDKSNCVNIRNKSVPRHIT